MKHNLKIISLLLVMFIATQLIGLYVVNFYLSDSSKLPYGFDQQNLPAPSERTTGFYTQLILSFIVSFAIAVFLVLLLMRMRSRWLIRGWFFVVISMALGITFTVLTTKIGLVYPSFFALLLGIFLAYIKIFERNIIVHNITELLIYPGIAAIFVALFNLWITVILLLLISVYDMWAVWRSKVMLKMAKFQISNLGMIGGFMIPYASDKIKNKIKLLRLKYKNDEIPQRVIKKQKIKVGLAILGGGDLVFPMIATGVFLKTFNSLPAALIVALFAALALLALFIFGKKKAYPAMPYLTAGILLGMLVGRAIAF
jgi:presenilin-like A22 family membrane protease